MKNLTRMMIAGSALILSACAHDERMDTRMQSFTAADANADSRLTFGEYQQYLEKEAAMGNDKAVKALSYEQKNRDKAVLLKFQQADLNRDTFLTRDELQF